MFNPYKFLSIARVNVIFGTVVNAKHDNFQAFYAIW